MSDIRYNSWLHRSGTGGVYQDSSGKVGIGSSVPGNALEIYGTASSVQIEVNGTGRYRGFEIHEGGTRKAYFQHDATDNCALLNTAEADLKFYTGDTQRMQLDGSGRLMIGNTAAASMFTVANNLVVGSGSGSEGMTIYSDSTNDGYICFADGQSDPAYRMGQIIYSHQSNKLQFRTNGNTDRLTIDNAGNTNISGVCTAKSFVPTEGQLSHRNLIINGDMSIAQRGTSFTANGYSVDLWRRTYSSGTAAVTQSALTSGAPFDAGFRYTLRHTQPSSAMSDAAGAYVNPQYYVEAQDLATSGWNYKDPNSYLTLSFWAKSSVAQTFYHYMIANDGTQQAFSFGYTLAANTWKKIEVQIPGNSNITIDNDTGVGLTLYFNLYFGTDRTDAGNTLNTWANWNSSSRTPVQTNTWFTTANATFDITGVQLEVGSTATPFEHRSHSEQLARCQRYFFNIKGDDNDSAGILGYALSTDEIRVKVEFPVPMREMPTYTGNAKDAKFKAGNVSGVFHWSNLSMINPCTTPNPKSTMMKYDKGSSLSINQGEGGDLEFHEDGGELQFSAEW